ncbi:MAG: UDP-N-acetylmuramate dehydrogenase [Saprospiraceae bacterium]|nr:UDP-N-acetylmuramate dehydrogenase [Saprospiraceae bacterium]MDW8230600.1 UDP-N-acetylmuramate dehydrogenase [Saprospiraceae bacterium]
MTPDVSLRPYNTFGVEARAAYFAEFASVAELRTALRQAVPPVLVLGGGSNILFTRDWPGTVLRNRICGIEVVRRFPHRVWVRAGGGEDWHELVMWAVRQNFGGIENLSLIPGSVGAAPVQNIGAYGVELKDVFISLEAVELATGRLRRFTRQECRFGYRDSIFKQQEKGRWCITAVTLSLTTDRHRLNTSYGDVARTLADMGVGNPTPAHISEAVVRIRQAKLPDPAHMGNCGSFFKNPEVRQEVWENIRQRYPNAPHYPLPNGHIKVPAGWLIEQCGWKGRRVGNVGCYEKQALVLVNHGGATGQEAHALAQAIAASVAAQFGIALEPEVNVW